jgi:hypothetical protein
MMEAVHTSETSVDNYFTRQYIPEDNSEQVLSYSPFSVLMPTWCILFPEVRFWSLSHSCINIASVNENNFSKK